MITTGTQLKGRYRLVSMLAQGGMGEIWRGWDKLGQRVVALKVLKEELAGQEVFLARLQAEAENASKMHHPNLAEVYDWGQQDGQGWIAMELVEGRPLSELLAGGGTLELDRVAHILGQIAQGLQAAHAHQIVHRDVKPSNILVDEAGRAKLTDFGISIAPDRVPLTAVGMVMGTAQYLPPEQAMGQAASAPGDIYALGVIAYEALAGRRPFTGPTQVDIAMSHVRDQVPALPDSVPEAAAELIYQMLAKDPLQRPGSAAEVARRFAEIRSLTAGQSSSPTSSQTSSSRTRPDPIRTATARPAAAKPATTRPWRETGYRAAPASPVTAPSATTPIASTASSINTAATLAEKQTTPTHTATDAATFPAGTDAGSPVRLEGAQWPRRRDIHRPVNTNRLKAVVAIIVSITIVLLLTVALALSLRSAPNVGSLESSPVSSAVQSAPGAEADTQGENTRGA